MGIDGAEIKRIRERKQSENCVSHSSQEKNESQDLTALKPLAESRSSIDRVIIYVFVVVVPVIILMIITRYNDDKKAALPKSVDRSTPVASYQDSSTFSSPGYAEVAAVLINTNLGNVCKVELFGFFSKTIKIDWTSQTNKLTAIMVLGEIGKMKERLYKDGVRYLQFPNDAGTYNVIDWETGEKKSISDRAPYYFEN